MYLKTKNGVTTTTQKGSAPFPEVRMETNAYRDPVDVVTGTITMNHCWSISGCRKENKKPLGQ